MSFLFKVMVGGGTLLVVKMAVLEYHHPIYQGRLDASKEVAIITGADQPTGAALSLHFAQRKARVIMACEDMEKCKYYRRRIVYRSENRKVACRQLDLTSYKSINEFADEMIEREPRISILVNHATARAPDNKRRITVDGVEFHLAHNFLGPFLLTQRLLEKMCASSPDNARVVNVIGRPKRNWDIDMTDLNMEKSYSRKRAYNQSKLAMALFTRHLAERMRDQQVNLFVYGIDTAGNVRPEALGIEHDPSYSDAVLGFIYDSLMLSPDQAISKATYCALEPALTGHLFSGRLYSKRNKRIPWKHKTNDKTLQELICKAADRWVHPERVV